MNDAETRAEKRANEQMRRELAWIKSEWLRVNAENKRLREALEEIYENNGDDDNVGSIAKQALEAK